MTITLTLILTLGTLGACSTHPLPEDVSRKNTYEIVEAIRCEAKRAINDYADAPEFQGAAIGYAFEFHIIEMNNSSASFLLQKQFADGTLFKLPVESSKANKTRDAKRVFTIVDRFETLRDATCGSKGTEKNLAYPITGSVGLYEVVGTFARLETQTSFAKGTPSAGLKVPTFSDTLTFTTHLSGGSFKPSYTAGEVTGKLILASASMDLSSTRMDTHKLTVALSLDPRFERSASSERRMSGEERQARTRGALQTFLSKSPVVALGRSNIITETDVQASDDAAARVLLELARRRQLEEEDKRLIELLAILKK